MFEELTPGGPDKPLTRLETGFLFPELVEPVAASPLEAETTWPENQGETEQAPTPPEPGDWKASLRRDFERWLTELEQGGQSPASFEEPPEAPDLYSFYEQLAAANVEARKANRRTAEAISQWGETLSRFDGALGPLRESIGALMAVQPKADQMSRGHCLVLLELLDRLRRLGQAFDSSPPKKGWWSGNDADWRQRWEAQRQALEIVLSHLEEFMKQQGVTRLEVVGQAFDPATMSAVAVAPEIVRAEQTVLEELAAGYQRQGELLRAAQVKVSAKANPAIQPG